MMDVSKIHEEARKLGSCDFLTGVEDFVELSEMLFTPQGTEFCKKFKFPSMELLKEYKGSQAESKGIYINTPLVGKNISKVALFGLEAIAELEFNRTEGFRIIVMHGAKVTIKASGYAVVFVTNAGGEVNFETSGNAKVL